MSCNVYLPASSASAASLYAIFTLLLKVIEAYGIGLFFPSVITPVTLAFCCANANAAADKVSADAKLFFFQVRTIEISDMYSFFSVRAVFALTNYNRLDVFFNRWLHGQMLKNDKSLFYIPCVQPILIVFGILGVLCIAGGKAVIAKAVRVCRHVDIIVTFG